MGYTKGIKWSKELIHIEALKYSRKVDFQKKSASAYNKALRNNFLDEVCSHMKVLRFDKRTFEDCLKVALKYKVKKDFQNHDHATYLFARRRGWINELTIHMKKNQYWDESRIEEIHQAALKYDSRGDFYKYDNLFYETARRYKWLDSVCSHMKPKGHMYRRLVYVYEFPDKSAYIGLTARENKRHQNHMTSDDSSVYLHIKKSGLTPIKKVLTDGYVQSEEAQKIEENMVIKYKQEGWNVLNRTKTGGLGVIKRIWTLEKLKELASNYKTKSEFRRNNKKAYNSMLKHKLMDEVCKDLINDDITYLTEEMVKEEIKKYTKLTDFNKNASVYRDWIYRNRRKDLTNHLEKKSIVNKEYIIRIAKNYESRTDFKDKNPYAYAKAVRNGWLNEACSHMKVIKKILTETEINKIVKQYKSRRELLENNRKIYNIAKRRGLLKNLPGAAYVTKWNKENVRHLALQYKNRWDFQKNQPGAWSFAKKHGIYDEICAHMTLLNTKGHKKDIHRCDVCGKNVPGITNLKRWHGKNCNPNRPHAKL